MRIADQLVAWPVRGGQTPPTPTTESASRHRQRNILPAGAGQVAALTKMSLPASCGRRDPSAEFREQDAASVINLSLGGYVRPGVMQGSRR
jgi:hypothetical protein